VRDSERGSKRAVREAVRESERETAREAVREAVRISKVVQAINHLHFISLTIWGLLGVLLYGILYRNVREQVRR
jgi:hypothetical protein